MTPCNCTDMGCFTVQCDQCALDQMVRGLVAFGAAITEAFKTIEAACLKFHEPEVLEAARFIARANGDTQ